MCVCLVYMQSSCTVLSYCRVDEGLDDVMVFRQHGSLVQLRANNHPKCGRYMNNLGKTCRRVVSDTEVRE